MGLGIGAAEKSPLHRLLSKTRRFTFNAKPRQSFGYHLGAFYPRSLKTTCVFNVENIYSTVALSIFTGEDGV